MCVGVRSQPEQGSPTMASVPLRGEVHVMGEEKATRMNQLLLQPICLCLQGPHAEFLPSALRFSALLSCTA